MKINILIITITLLIASISSAGPIQDIYKNIVVPLGDIQNDGKELKFVAQATGFLMSIEVKNSDIGTSPSINQLFLITAYHFTKERDSFIVRFNALDTENNSPKEGFIYNKIDLHIKAGTYDSPHIIDSYYYNSDYDIALIPIHRPKNVDCLAINETLLATPDDLKNFDISESTDVFFICFLPEYFGKKHNYPFIRSGKIALISTELIPWVIDAQVFPGNSGSPVFLFPTTRKKVNAQITPVKPFLIGIVTGHIPYKDVAISMQTKQPRVIFEENQGLGTILPSPQIFEVIDRIKKMDRLRNAPFQEIKLK